jgi:hypothetical protein
MTFKSCQHHRATGCITCISRIQRNIYPLLSSKSSRVSSESRRAFSSGLHRQVYNKTRTPKKLKARVLGDKFGHHLASRLTYGCTRRYGESGVFGLETLDMLVATSNRPVPNQSAIADSYVQVGECDLESFHTALKIFVRARTGKMQHFVDIRSPKEILDIFVACPQRSVQYHFGV